MSDEQDPAPPPAADALAPLPGADELMTIADAARLGGLATSTLRRAAAEGRLQVEAVTPRLNMTTRRWLNAYLHSRGQGRMGRPPKPLPAGYQPPGPGRPRKPAVRPTPPTQQQDTGDDQT